MKATVPILLLYCAVAASHSTPARAQEPAASADLAAKVVKLFAVIDPRTSPGCAVAIMKDGRIVHKGGYGLADLDHDVPITPSTIFQVGSLSKQFTAAAIVLLAQDGKLALDDEVRKHLPEFPDFGERITIRHLLHHTSGVRDQLQLLALTGWRYTQDLITDEDVMELVARQKSLNFRPGGQHMYSNTGYTLLAQIVKRVSGTSFREFTTARIFQPLGMSRTHFRDEFGEVVKGQAYGYVPRALLNRPSPDSPVEASAAPATRRDDGFRLNAPNSDNVGPTNLLTTVEDLALWDENFYQPRVGGPALIRQLLQRGTLNNGEEVSYALGLGHGTYRGQPTVEHPGSDAGFASDLLRFPDDHFSVALTCNRAGSSPSNLARRIADIYLADKLGPVERGVTFTPVTLTDGELSSCVGLYLDDVDMTVIRIARKPDQSSTLLVRREEFRPADKLHFHSTTGPRLLEFEAVASGKPARVVLKDRGIAINTFTRVAEVALTAAQMKEYAGDFFSEEIDPVFRISIENGKLFLRRVHNAPAVLDPLRSDLFQVGGGRVTMEFVRGAQHQITGFLFSTTRIRNMTFRRGGPSSAR
jgi:CubicO group peptidase (beta-lactamase class C family)